jgi:hypothetical protein
VTRQGDGADRLARLAASIRSEIDRLVAVVAEAELALRDFSEITPPLRELRGIGDIVHDFYTGIERIFEKIAPELNGGVPAGSAWHRELLESMALDLPTIRPPVIGRETVRILGEYLRFRHLFRNVYGFELEWERLQPLLKRLPAAWVAFQTDIRHFLVFLDEASIRAPESN